MAQLENLLTTIQSSGEAQATKLIETAELEATKQVEDATKEALKLKEQMIEAGKKEAAHAKKTYIQSKELLVRDDKLAAKQRIISQVLLKAIEIISHMSGEDFEEYVEKSLLQSHTGKKGVLVVPAAFADVNIEKIGKNTQNDITLSTDYHVENGFVFISGGIEYNNTFTGLMGFMRDDLELFVSQELF